MASDARVKIIRMSFSTSQTFELVELPDIPGIVVLVSLVTFMVESFSSATGLSIRLYHNIDDSVTLAFANVPGTLWMNISMGINSDPSQASVVYNPPIEMIGKQRLDAVSSAGTVVGHLMIHYTTRREPNRTVWNELRARTSREGG